MKQLRTIFIICALLIGLTGFSQPYADILNFNYQGVKATYKDSFGGNNAVNNFVLNLMVPIKLDSQNTIIIRWFGERLNTSTVVKSNTRVPYNDVTANNDVEYSNQLYASFLPVGMQHENKKWKYMLLAMPKIAGTVGEKVTKDNFQAGVYAMVTRKVKDNLAIKGGLFYNREFFGNFFVPIISVDWKVNSKFQMYGTFPTFYKFEYQLAKQKVYTGISYRSYTRSFLLSGPGKNYMRINDLSLKYFIDFYIKKKLLLYAEFGRMLNYSLLDYQHNSKTEILTIPTFRKVNQPFFINCGIAYRIRFDFDK
ncbi:MAG TPA: DUF6268 family outer membrane beta-barrel protein [Bacteroidia bacterium]